MRNSRFYPFIFSHALQYPATVLTAFAIIFRYSTENAMFIDIVLMQIPSSHDKFVSMFTCKMIIIIIINFADYLQARETAVTISSRNKSIVGAFGADVDPSDTDDGTAYLLYLSGIVGMKLGSRSKRAKSSSSPPCSRIKL